ncbi:MAG: hypothetical protein WC549_00390 [Actinomycetota bacterium]
MHNETINIWTAGALETRKISIVNNATDILELIKIGKKLNNFYTHSCNGYNSEKYDRLALKWEKKAQEITKRMKVYIYFQTDPRGGTIYIDNKPIPNNNYTQAVFLG